MGKIDSAGTFIATILESGVTTTKKGFPQWVARFKATQKFVTDPADLAHFQLTEPGYVDWSSFDEEIVGFSVLFKSTEEFVKETALLNYEQLQLATGWDGTEFDSLGNGTFVGKSIQIRVEEDTYEGKTSLKVNWIDNAEANPERSLKTLDAADVKALSAKLKISKPAPVAKPAAAKPAATKPAATKPVANPTPAPAPAAPAVVAAAGTTVAAPTTSAPKPPKSTKVKPAAPAPVAEETEETPAYPAETTQDAAWAAVVARKGGVDDTALQDGWIAGCQEAGGDLDEDDFTPAIWGKVRDLVIAKLGL